MYLNLRNNKCTIIFSGDSGSGIQYIGNCFAYTCSQLGLYIKTYSIYPSDIKPPFGTSTGLSSFKISFSYNKFFYMDDFCNYLIAMNPFALKKYFNNIMNNGSLVINNINFSYRNLLLSGFKDNILEILKCKYHLYTIDHPKELNDFFIKNNYTYLNKIRSINMFILGFLHHLCCFPIIHTKKFLTKSINFVFIQKGYYFYSTDQTITTNSYCKVRTLNKCLVNGNEAIALGLLYACYSAGVELFYASYPITPASSISEYLVNNSHFKPKVFQSEDEISAICSSIGASYAGHMGVVGTSGPGASLMQESIGLVSMLELPLLIINVQRAGPSTGIPTRTEQSDLMQAVYGRHGEAPVPVFSSKSPVDCFYTTYQAIKTALEHMTPVILLSDFELSNSLECWIKPDLEYLDKIKIVISTKGDKPYQRDNKYVRPWITPGSKEQEHYIGSLEKKHISGQVSYSSSNHKLMVNLRQLKVNTILKYIPDKYIYDFHGNNKGHILIISWGSLYGVIRESVYILQREHNIFISHLHIQLIYPLCDTRFKYVYNFNKILIFELNNKQLYYIFRSYYLVNMIFINKLSGILLQDIINQIVTLLN
jgi:2-oxoglutarate ferredoxin oxidoreductase subunit alpha